ncbi:hypothetical protein, partial [Prevotella fusca]|uniref:hypothetical protein n=1 Tax=Prevotella fusca TaxID=589436 RepID=UPI003F9FBA76
YLFYKRKALQSLLFSRKQTHNFRENNCFFTRINNYFRKKHIYQRTDKTRICSLLEETEPAIKLFIITATSPSNAFKEEIASSSSSFTIMHQMLLEKSQKNILNLFPTIKHLSISPP